MRRRSGDVVGVLVVNALRRSRFRSVAKPAPHESGIIASLTVFVVRCLLLLRFSAFVLLHRGVRVTAHAHLGKSYSLTGSLAVLVDVPRLI